MENFVFDKLILISDSEYGTHVYYKHAYKNITLDFWTSCENFKEIIDIIIEKLEIREK